MLDSLKRGRLGPRCVHLCVDMQSMFTAGSPWEAPWFARVLPTVVRIAEARPERTVFTRFIPAARAGDGVGTWKSYYEHWPEMTQERLASGQVDLVPELQRFVPPGEVVDKAVYSPWMNPQTRGNAPPP